MSRHVRPLRRDDLPRVARLFADTFRSGRRPHLPTIADRLGRAYFDNPWADPEIPSLVHDDGRTLAGFLGVVPRPMRLGERDVVAAVTGNLMVEPGRAGAFVSLQLSRTCVRGPQDLTISDSGLDHTRRIAERSGAVTARLYSLRFERRTGPLADSGHDLLRWRAPRVHARVAAPLARLDRRLAQRLHRGPYRRFHSGCRVEPMTISELSEAFGQLPDYALRPSYDPAALAWMLDCPPRGDAELRIRRVTDPEGRLAGVFVYYLDPGAPSDVVLVVGPRPRLVLQSLVDDAIGGGARALTGRADPQQLLDLDACRFRLGADNWVLVHADDPQILEPFLRGEAFFPTLDGERWSMRFVDEPM